MKKKLPIHDYFQPSTLAILLSPLMFVYLSIILISAVSSFIFYPDESMKYRYLLGDQCSEWFKAAMGNNDFNKNS